MSIKEFENLESVKQQKQVSKFLRQVWEYNQNAVFDIVGNNTDWFIREIEEDRYLVYARKNDNEEPKLIYYFNFHLHCIMIHAEYLLTYIEDCVKQHEHIQIYKITHHLKKVDTLVLLLVEDYLKSKNSKIDLEGYDFTIKVNEKRIDTCLLILENKRTKEEKKYKLWFNEDFSDLIKISEISLAA